MTRAANTVALIDYGSGNVRSVRRAVEAAAAHAELDVRVALTADPETIAAADHVLLPGVGHFADCAAGLAERAGVVEAMREAVSMRGRPFLGVCVGMQLMATTGREDGDTPGLGWIPGEVSRIDPSDPSLPIPHMGWNEIAATAPHPVLLGFSGGEHVYFTHSYVFRPERAEDAALTFDYGGPFTAGVARDNLFGVQFHPEKSQTTGLRLLANFLRWEP